MTEQSYRARARAPARFFSTDIIGHGHGHGVQACPIIKRASRALSLLPVFLAQSLTAVPLEGGLNVATVEDVDRPDAERQAEQAARADARYHAEHGGRHRPAVTLESAHLAGPDQDH